jgi:hypothetical protein
MEQKYTKLLLFAYLLITDRQTESTRILIQKNTDNTYVYKFPDARALGPQLAGLKEGPYPLLGPKLSTLETPVPQLNTKRNTSICA